MGKVAVVDFDKTIINSKFPGMGTPMPGAKEGLEELKRLGFEINILSCRTSPEVYKHEIDRTDQVRQMEQWMKDNNIPFDRVLNLHKPLADLYVDDCGVGFRGNWEKTIEEIKQIHGDKDE
jgi:hypothetical protein